MNMRYTLRFDPAGDFGGIEESDAPVQPWAVMDNLRHSCVARFRSEAGAQEYADTLNTAAYSGA